MLIQNNGEYKNKKLIDEKSSTFTHYGFSEDDTCIVSVTVQEVEYLDTKKRYFYISYNFDLGKNTNFNIRAHPFYSNKDMLENNSDGEIIFKNSLSEKLIEYLLMEDKELEGKTGLGTVWNYKGNIMRMITHLWD